MDENLHAPKMNALYETIAEIPQIARGLVWCTKCGRKQMVKGSSCLRYGWPRCCGYTMTIDSPEERRALSAGEPR
jgi:hypothetical protein